MAIAEHTQVPGNRVRAAAVVIANFLLHVHKNEKLDARLHAHWPLVPSYRYRVQGHSATRSRLGRVALQPPTVSESETLTESETEP